MAGPGLPWTEILPSRERAHWLRAAAVACAMAAAVLAVGLARQPTALLGLAVVLLSLGAALAWSCAAAPPPRLQLRIDAEGTIWLRPSAAGVAESTAFLARPRHVSGRLVTLAGAGGVVALWPDSVPGAAFRRLAAHARWHIERSAPRGPLAGA